MEVFRNFSFRRVYFKSNTVFLRKKLKKFSFFYYNCILSNKRNWIFLVRYGKKSSLLKINAMSQMRIKRNCPKFLHVSSSGLCVCNYSLLATHVNISVIILKYVFQNCYKPLEMLLKTSLYMAVALDSTKEVVSAVITPIKVGR
jgi:hypothetical protein